MSNPRTSNRATSRLRWFVFVTTMIAAAVVPAADGRLGSDVPAEAASEGFIETFDTPQSLDRFDYGVHHAWIANETDNSWIGDHDRNCGPPEPGRTIKNPTAIDGKTYYRGMRKGVVYWCNEHLMTSFNTNHYAQVDFSPKQVFDQVKRVCWDQNRTDVGARMWTQVVVVNTDTFNANNGRLDYVASRLSPEGPGAFGIHPTDDTFLIELTDGGSRAQTGQFVDEDGSGNWLTTDKATRYQICVEDLENGRVRMEMAHASGVQVRTLQGSMPNGPARVIFQHDLYNPDKDPGVANGYTWHWDNTIVETSDWKAPPVTSNPPPVVGGTSEYRSFTPQRVFDSRFATPEVPSHPAGAQLAAGSVTAIPIAGRHGVAKDAKAVVINLTAAAAPRPGHLTAGACGTRPAVSTVNFAPAEARANLATVPLDAQGRICIWTIAPTHAIVDVSGFYPAGSGYTPIKGLRYLDTRSANGTFDGAGAVGRVGAGREVEVKIAGRGPIPASAGAVALNLTSAGPSGPGHALAYPCGTQRPNASNLNYATGQNVASGGLVAVGRDGKICIYTHAKTDFVVDVSGWLPSSSFQRLVPARLSDTRAGAQTVDGRSAGSGANRGGTTRRIPLHNRGGVPGNAAVVAVHVTVAAPTAAGHASAFPCDQPSLGTSTLNYRAGETVTNGAIILATGDLCVYTHATAHVIVDVEGYFAD